jgi:hypothetical protein
MRSLVSERRDQQHKGVVDLLGYFCPDFVISHKLYLPLEIVVVHALWGKPNTRVTGRKVATSTSHTESSQRLFGGLIKSS